MNLPIISFKSGNAYRARLMAGFLSLVVLLAGTITLAGAASNTSGIDSLSPVQAGNAAGAHLPVNYSLSSLTGQVLYASSNGSNSSDCSLNSPCTIVRAVSQVTSQNSTVVLRGGVYRGQRNIEISGSARTGLRLVAFPGEIPEFNGAVQVSTASWTTENNLKFQSYSPRPVLNGGGLDYGDYAAANQVSGCTNLNGDCVGMYADQVWIGATALKQVIQKNQIQDGKFFVDQANKRLYLTVNDAAKANIETSRPSTDQRDRDRLFRVLVPNVKIEGVRITRYSPNANDYGVIAVEGSASGSLLENIEVSHLPYDGISVGEGNNGSVIRNLTMSNVAWQGITSTKTDNFTLDSVIIRDGDQFDEFTSSPASGAYKTSRNRNTTVKNSLITNNNSHGLWFDQSNINMVVANNLIIDNKDSGVFFEISDGLLLINNYIRGKGSSTPVRMIGSSGLKVVNNTIVGGAYPLGIYTDGRSIPGCSSRPSDNPCEYSSDMQNYFPRPVTMDWMPRADLIVNNIFANPTGGTSTCGSNISAVCIMTAHSSGANAPIDTIFHKADPSRGIPQTYVNGNVYANGSGTIARVTKPFADYPTVSAYSKAMLSLTGLNIDADSLSGSSYVNADGTPTSTLSSLHGQAVAVPVEATINKYVPAGTKHYGALSDGDAPAPTTTVAPTTRPVTTAAPTTAAPTTVAPTTTTRPTTTTTRPPSTTVPLTTTTTRPPTTTTTTTTTTTPPPSTPPTVDKDVDIAVRAIMADFGLSKLKITNFNASSNTLKARAYLPSQGFLYLAADISVVIKPGGEYNISSVNWIVSFKPIK